MVLECSACDGSSNALDLVPLQVEDSIFPYVSS
jgi:hypothetical protein